ncbi:DNA methylase [Salmonella enterica]|uniref:DNA methylase n=1 Tax=Salmonella enterica TaxID=28901 RepID=A0A379SE48_SALER|nr:DNA methylase [Salmonella enterica]
MNNGDVRILIGSTSKMVLVQTSSVAWSPYTIWIVHGGREILNKDMVVAFDRATFFEQDKENFELEICCYATERTYDARMWQTIEVKARGIEQFRNGFTDRSRY